MNYTVGRTEKVAWAPVGELNNAYRDTVATFTYGRKADSEFSVGVKLAGGDWEAQGSTTVHTERGAEQTRSRRGPYARRLFSKFLFRKERVITCAPFGPESDVVRAVRWDGGWGSVKQRRTIRVCRTGLTPFRRDDSFHDRQRGGGHLPRRRPRLRRGARRPERLLAVRVDSFQVRRPAPQGALPLRGARRAHHGGVAHLLGQGEA